MHTLVREELPRVSQVLREMQAIVRAAVFAGRERRCLVATDADVCRHAIEKQYSRSPALRDCLRSIRAACAAIEVLRVPGEENPADEPSRGKEVDRTKLLRTMERFVEAVRIRSL